MRQSVIHTSQGAVAFTDGGGEGFPLIMLHGNSGCRQAFSRQFTPALTDMCRLIAIDLPGHGASADARNPAQAYMLSGFATTVIEVMERLGLDRPAILGWSMGGHIAMEMAAMGSQFCGMMLVGAPPVSPGLIGMLRGFRSDYDLLLASKAHLTPKEAARFGAACFGDALEPRFIDSILRTDPHMRPTMVRCMMFGRAADERRLMAELDVPVAIVNGVKEPFARQDYLDHLIYADLWEGRTFVLEGAGHAPFFEQPEAFNALLLRFLRRCAEKRSALQFEDDASLCAQA